MHTTLSGLRRYTNYSVTVCAFTAAGDGVRAAPVYCHTEEDGKSKTNRQSNKDFFTSFCIGHVSFRNLKLDYLGFFFQCHQLRQI